MSIDPDELFNRLMSVTPPVNPVALITPAAVLAEPVTEDVKVVEIGTPEPVEIESPDLVEEVIDDGTPFGSIEATTKVEEALSFGGLDYEVEPFAIKPVLIGAPDEPEDGWVIPVFTGIRRCDDRKVVFTVLRETYTPVQNREVLELVHPLLIATGGEFTRVGSTDNGAQVFAYVTLHETVALPGDVELKKELVFTSSHDGSKCLEMKVVATLDGATIGQSHGYGLRHTKGVSARSKAVAKLIEFKDKFFSELSANTLRLSKVKISDKAASDWLKTFLDYPDDSEAEVHPLKAAQHERLFAAFQSAITGRNTRLALALAVAHDRAYTAPVRQTKHYVSTKESRFKSSLNGHSARQLDAAWNELLHN